MADISSLYPPPPAPVAAPTNGFANMTPAGVVGLVQGINASKLFQQQYDARQGVADAYRNNVRPDGSIDETGLVRDLAKSGFGAGEALHQGTVNSAAQFDLQSKFHQVARDVFGSLADVPNLSKSDVYSAAAKLARQGVPADIIRSYIADAPNSKAGLVKWSTQLGNMAQGSGAASVGEGGPPAPTGAAQSITHGAANFERRGVGNVAAPGMPTELPPGTKTTMEGSANMYNEAVHSSGQYANRVNPLRQAIPILENMKNTDTGPITDRLNEMKSAAQSLGAGTLLGIDPEKIKDFNELKKYFNQYSSQAAAVLGPKTNEGLATAVTSNPNVHMDRLSALDLSKVAMGVERMRQAGILEFNRLVDLGKKQPSDFGRYMTDFATKQDPRAFVYDLMTKDQQKKLKEGLSKSELDKIRNGMNLADRHGLLGDVHQ